MAEEKTWQPLELVKVTADYLAGKKIPDARVDAEILLCEVMGLRGRVDLYAGFEKEVTPQQLASYRECVRRRAAREPVSRILGRRDFMGIRFTVGPEVLSPRPETELLVEAALEAFLPKKKPLEKTSEEAAAEADRDAARPETEADSRERAALDRLLDSYAEDVEDEAELERDGEISVKPKKDAIRGARPADKIPAPPSRKFPVTLDAPLVRALDLGTGSGCIAVALAAKMPSATLVAVDASPRALALAKRNAAAANVLDRISFRQGDWLGGCKAGERFEAILANPPYLVQGDPEIWPEVAKYDPPLALYGGKDGLDCYRRIVPDAPEFLAEEGWLFLEVGAGQAAWVRDLLIKYGFRAVGVVRDYAGVERVVKGKAPK